LATQLDSEEDECASPKPTGKKRKAMQRGKTPSAGRGKSKKQPSQAKKKRKNAAKEEKRQKKRKLARK